MQQKKKDEEYFYLQLWSNFQDIMLGEKSKAGKSICSIYLKYIQYYLRKGERDEYVDIFVYIKSKKEGRIGYKIEVVIFYDIFLYQFSYQ